MVHCKKFYCIPNAFLQNATQLQLIGQQYLGFSGKILWRVKRANNESHTYAVGYVSSIHGTCIWTEFEKFKQKRRKTANRIKKTIDVYYCLLLCTIGTVGAIFVPDSMAFIKVLILHTNSDLRYNHKCFSI